MIKQRTFVEMPRLRRSVVWIVTILAVHGIDNVCSYDNSNDSQPLINYSIYQDGRHYGDAETYKEISEDSSNDESVRNNQIISTALSLSLLPTFLEKWNDFGHPDSTITMDNHIIYPNASRDVHPPEVKLKNPKPNPQLPKKIQSALILSSNEQSISEETYAIIMKNDTSTVITTEEPASNSDHVEPYPTNTSILSNIIKGKETDMKNIRHYYATNSKHNSSHHNEPHIIKVDEVSSSPFIHKNSVPFRTETSSGIIRNHTFSIVDKISSTDKTERSSSIKILPLRGLLASNISDYVRNAAINPNISVLLAPRNRYTSYMGSGVLSKPVPKKMHANHFERNVHNTFTKPGQQLNSTIGRLGKQLSIITGMLVLRHNSTNHLGTDTSNLTTNLENQNYSVNQLEYDDFIEIQDFESDVYNDTQMSVLNSKSSGYLKPALSNVSGKLDYLYNFKSHSKTGVSNYTQTPILNYRSSGNDTEKNESRYNFKSHYIANVFNDFGKNILQHNRSFLKFLLSSNIYLNRQKISTAHASEINDTHTFGSKPIFLVVPEKNRTKLNSTANNRFGLTSYPNPRKSQTHIKKSFPEINASTRPADKLFSDSIKKLFGSEMELTGWSIGKKPLPTPLVNHIEFSTSSTLINIPRTDDGFSNISLSEVKLPIKNDSSIKLNFPRENFTDKFISQSSNLASEPQRNVVRETLQFPSGNSSEDYTAYILQNEQQNGSISIWTTQTLDQQFGDPKRAEESNPNLNLEVQQHIFTSTEIINTNYTTEYEEHVFRNIIEWEKSQESWGLAWELHVYVMGSFFGVLSLYVFQNILRLRAFEKLFTSGYFISITLIMFVMGTTRALYLLFNPYNIRGFYPPILNELILNSGFLCITSAFAFLFLALLQTTEVKVFPQFVQSIGFVSGILIFQFTFSIMTDILHGLGLTKKILLLTRQVTVLFWAMTMAAGYFYVFGKLQKSAVTKQIKMIRIALTRLHIEGDQLPPKLPKPNLCLAVRLTTMIAVLIFLIVALHVFGIIYVNKIFHTEIPKPWAWWGYQLGDRILELLICFSISFVTTLPMSYMESKKSKCCNVFFQNMFNSVEYFCSENEEADSEIFPICFANYQSHPNPTFHTAPLERPRRLNHTNSLPTIPTFYKELGSGSHWKKISIAEGHEEEQTYPSRTSFLPSDISKPSTNLMFTTDNRPVISQSKLAERQSASLLYIDQGYIRFRTAADHEQPLHLSEDEPTEEESYHDENESTRVYGGSSIHTLCEDDFEQSSLSPYFHTGFHHSRLKRTSRWSLDTADNSIELSPELLSNVNELSTSMVELTPRKQGSTCSSESAANSFNVAFFFNRSARDAPNISQILFGEVYEEKTYSVDIPGLMARSVSPITACARRNHEFQLNLNLPYSKNEEQVNVACGTEDITPDSAVYLDLQLSQENSCLESTNVLLETSRRKSSFSHSMTDLNKLRTFIMSPDECSKTKQYSWGFFDRLKYSTFSLNANMNSYEPLKSDDITLKGACALHRLQTEVKLRRSSSDNGPALFENCTFFTSLRNVKKGTLAKKEQLYQGDSGLLKDSSNNLIQVDQACQTDPMITQEKCFTTRNETKKDQCGRSMFNNKVLIV
ncbi:uncharacterized protein LOC111087446 [Limulus polyphemus]|uniref:Uncharacterized protein LOC111087446 n=1 Tax=Limulus polyphemus TaxID=6850 RepID=A0ABM1T1N5_LIMPO|nr:uncharacterized protein LOC111087446 [Limulus polyphemus]